MRAIIVHGGAWDIPDDQVSAHEAGCSKALDAGWGRLGAGGSVLDAAIAAVLIMEEDETFDAGRGSFLNREGEVELDAAVMVSTGMRVGAVAAVKRLRNPILAARAVLEEGESVLLVGEGAEELAREKGMTLCDPSILTTARERERFRVSPRDQDPLFSFGGAPSDTVGAVAVDDGGEVAVAVSTGGRPLKRRGRVGDSPIPGAGFLAQAGLGGTCSTGWGEGILRVSMARCVVDALGTTGPEEACRLGVRRLLDLVGGRGGSIALTPRGEIGYAFNTPRLAVAWRRGAETFTGVLELGGASVRSGP